MDGKVVEVDDGRKVQGNALSMWMGRGRAVLFKRSAKDILKTFRKRDLENPIKVGKLLICGLN